MKLRDYVIPMGCVVLLSMCAPALSVHYDYNKSTNFNQYKTFAMYKLDERNNTISQLNADRIIRGVKAEMVKKGFTEQSNNPDLVVNAVVILKDKKVVTSNTDYYGYGGLYRPYGWGDGTGITTYQVSNYADGSLIIDVLDAKTQKLVWEGTGNQEIDGPIQDPDAKIPAAISKIMANFPPKPQSGMNK